MASVVDLLGSIVKPGTIAAVSLTGLVSAFGIALLLWPPTPTDIVHIPWKVDIDLIRVPEDCREHPEILKHATDPGDFRSIAVENQSTLDKAQESIQRCLDVLTSTTGAEATLNKQLTDEIAVIKAEQAAAQTNYLAYQKSGSPLESHFYNIYLKDTDRIKGLESEIAKNEQAIRDQTLRFSTYNNSLKLVQQRLQDPGRIRPIHNFDDVLQGLANHVVAFLGLAVVIGTAIQPLQRVFLGLFDDVLKTN